MDPITGVSLVASVAQLITFGIDSVQAIRKVYEHGSTGIYDDVEYTSERLTSLARSLQQSLSASGTQPAGLNSPERDLITIGQKCEDCAQALQHELGKLHARPHSSVLAAARKTARSIWSRRKIEDISKQLETYRSTLETSLLYQLSKRFEAQACLTNKSFTSLDQGLQHVFKCLSDSNTSLAKLTATGNDQIRSHTTAQIQHLEQRQQDQRLYDELLKSLFYPDIFSRQEQVDHVFDGIHNTYEWIFQGPHSEDGSRSTEGFRKTATPRLDDFPLWLKSGQGIYWINGKAGSGKSTLMNYIWQHHLTLDLLKEWCVDRVLLTPAYFFWAAGSRQQKSMDGLLRSLIYQLLKAFPELIAHLQIEMLYTWTDSRLQATLLKMIVQTQVPVAVCLFLDGLDEMEGQFDSAIRVVRHLISHVNVKVCLSSRPLLIFEEAFSNAPGLRLQDLTFSSIQKYADDRLSSLSQTRLLQNNHDGDGIRDLVNKIVERADGVFLWAVIAVRDVRDGLQGFADLDEVAQAINSLPPELDGLFMLMLHRIKPAYQRDAARFLQIMLHLPIDGGLWERWGSTSIDLGTLHFIRSQRNLEDAPFIYERIPTKDIEVACRILRIQLRSHTAGLLELRPGQYADPEESINDILINEDPVMGIEVNFIHRTARDFLSCNDEAKAFLARKGFTEAQVHLAIAKGTLAQLEHFPGNDRSFSEYIVYAKAVKHISLAEGLLGGAQSVLMQSLVDEAHHQLYALPTRRDYCRLERAFAIYEDSLTIDVVAMAAASGMTLYVCKQLDISTVTGDWAADLPSLTEYSSNGNKATTLTRALTSRKEYPDATRASQTDLRSYRQTLSKRLQLDLHPQAHSPKGKPASSTEGLCPTGDAYSDTSETAPPWANHAFAETYLLSCCTPSCHDLVRTLLHAGANPMVDVDSGQWHGRKGRQCFWERWLSLLQESRCGYMQSFGKSGGIVLDETYSRLGLTTASIFDITKSLLANGADINIWIEEANSEDYECYLKRRNLANSPLDLILEATAIFVLEECFNKEPEFRDFATAIKSLVKVPTRRLLKIESMSVHTSDALSYTSAGEATISAGNCELLWPLIEQWETTGLRNDLEALQLAMERIWRSQQTCGPGYDNLCLAELMTKLATEKAED